MRPATILKVLVAAGALGGGIYAAMPDIAGRPTMATANEPEKTAKVDVVQARRATVARRLVSNATLEAFEGADLFAKVSGYLTDVRVDIGDHVVKGQLLASVDVPELEQEVAEAVAQLEARRRSLDVAQRQLEHNKADLALQEVTFRRQHILNKESWVSDQALDEIRAKADVARADVQSAEASRELAAAQVDLAQATVEKNKALLAYTRIVAPFDGVISVRRVNRGDLVQAPTAGRAMPLFRIERIDVMRVFCDVPEKEVPLVHTGAQASLKMFGLSGEPIAGTVTRFAFRLDPETRNMRTEIDLQNPNERLYPGMYAEVSLELERHDRALTLPVTAVGSDADGTFVYVVQDERVTRKAVKTGLRDGSRIEVTEGIAEGVAVLTNAKSAPSAGTRVQVANAP